jgi:octanoyl-[GcvH]:protein N-octanoyltransferase
VVLVTDPEPVREVLVDAYAALGMDWRPASVGCVADHVPGVGVSDVERALLPELRELLPGLIDDEATPGPYVRK